MFIYNGKKLENVFYESINRKEKENIFFELYIEGIGNENKVSVNLLFNIDSNNLNLLEMELPTYMNEYLIKNECYFGVNQDFSLIDLEDLNVEFIKIDKNIYEVIIDSYENNFNIDVELNLEDKNEEM